MFTLFACSVFYIISDTKMEEEAETSASSTGGIAIYIDSGDGYELSNSSEFPTGSAYTLNTTYSTCTNGGTISQDSETKAISVSVSGSDYCTLYYEKLQTLSEYVISLADTETTPDFSTVATDDEGVFAMEDDYGELSYYFRGAVENNYVYFAGYYWRIVRVNGDGTVRLIYDGSESAYANGTSSTDRYIGTSKFNEAGASPAYAGYMYGDLTDTKLNSTSISISSSYSYYYGSSYTYDTSTGYYTLSGSTTSGVWSSIYSDVISTYKYTCKSTSSTTCDRLYEITAYSSSTAATGYTHILNGSAYDEVTENTNDSTIKITLDNWYVSNLLDTTYESYLADGIFCNDRSVYSGDGYSLSSSTYYSAYNRLITNKSPQLTCNQQNDAFTVDDTTYGNGDLTYPIGLITADELAIAGGVYQTDNLKFYLYTGNNFWTMSPSFYQTTYYYQYLFIQTKYEISQLSAMSSNEYIRPVINLKSDVLISCGDGTMDSPFEVTL